MGGGARSKLSLANKYNVDLVKTAAGTLITSLFKKKQKLFSIRVKKLFEPMALHAKKDGGFSSLPFLEKPIFE